MDRRTFVSGALLWLAAPSAAWSQRESKVHRIGYLSSGFIASLGHPGGNVTGLTLLPTGPYTACMTVHGLRSTRPSRPAN